MKSITKLIIRRILSSFTNSGIVYKEGDDREAIMYQAAHYELVASARAVKVSHEINPDFQIGCMIAMYSIIRLLVIQRYSYGYESYAEALLLYRRACLLVDYLEHILKYWEEIKVDFSKQDQEDLLAIVDYIGFSYYMSFAIDSHRENNPTSTCI